jgi:transcriptional regulator with XRE-family HTH domain
MTEIGKAIRARRIAAKLTQSQLAKSMGIKQSTLSDLERGQSQPSLELVRRAEDALELELGTLLRSAGLMRAEAGDLDLAEILEQLRAATTALARVAEMLGVPTPTPGDDTEE